MDHELDAMGMLDLMVRPGFCVKDHEIIKCNPAAHSLLFRPGMDISPLLATGGLEYSEFSEGCLYLTLEAAGKRWGASVNRVGGLNVFLLEEEADQSELKSMALAARELRNPLSRIMSTAEQLFPMSALEDNPALLEQAALLNRGLYQMLRIISNMADAGEYAAAPAPALDLLNIPGFMQEIFEKAKALASHAGYSLDFQNLPQPLFCLADSEKLERAILNILSNAMKFTPAGGRIDAKLTRRGSRLYLSVQDSGDGIPEELRGSIHRRYLRQPGLEDDRFGIGLGMVLIRSAAAMHGGTVLIDHPEGAGTRITMTLAIRQDNSGNVRSPGIRFDYAGARDHALLELSEKLPAQLYDPQKTN